MRLVIADDHALFRDSLRSLLTARNLEVVGEASNGREAVDMARSLRPDVVLMDLSMPEMGGLEATTKIREMERETGKHTPIVALTAHAMKIHEEQCLSAGMDGYVTKPISRTKLFEIIESFLSDP